MLARRHCRFHCSDLLLYGHVSAELRGWNDVFPRSEVQKVNLLPWRTSQKGSASLLLATLPDSRCSYSPEPRLSQLNEVILRNDGFSLKEPRFSKNKLHAIFLIRLTCFVSYFDK